MKILLICSEDKIIAAERLIPLLTEMEIPAEILALASQNYMDIGRITSLLAYSSGDSPTHAIIVTSLSDSWLDFLAGFACGSRIPFLVYGNEAEIGIKPAIVFSFTAFRAEEALKKYLLAEEEAYLEKAEAMVAVKAREKLLEEGIPLTDESLALCTAENRVKEVSLFFTGGFSPDTRNKTGVPLLCIAARGGNREVLRFLLSSGANPDLQSGDRNSTALIDSVMGNHEEQVTDLVKAGADLNLRTKDGQTAIVLAVGTGNERIAETLLEAGADADIADNLGVSARKYAALFGKKNITALIEKHTPLKEAQ